MNGEWKTDPRKINCSGMHAIKCQRMHSVTILFIDVTVGASTKYMTGINTGRSNYHNYYISTGFMLSVPTSVFPLKLKTAFKSKNTKLKCIVDCCNTSPRNHKCQNFTYLRKFPGGNTDPHPALLCITDMSVLSLLTELL